MKRTVAEQMTLIREFTLSVVNYNDGSHTHTWQSVREKAAEILQQPLLSAPWGEIVAGKVTPMLRLKKGRRGK